VLKVLDGVFQGVYSIVEEGDVVGSIETIGVL